MILDESLLKSNRLFASSPITRHPAGIVHVDSHQPGLPRPAESNAGRFASESDPNRRATYFYATPRDPVRIINVTCQAISIDGSRGEGGGQILRTAVGLAAATGKAVRLTNIRASRPKPGLGHQHLAAVRAAAAVCKGTLTGDEIGSPELLFVPGRIVAGRHRFDIGTAGSTSLVLQTVIPALMLADGDSQITVTGGTHNPWAPCFEYMRDVFASLAGAANLQAYFAMPRAGFYPAGGGEVRMDIRGLGSGDNVAPLHLIERGELRYIDGVSIVAGRLPAEICDRQCRQVIHRLAESGQTGSIEQSHPETVSPGTAVFVRAVFTRSVAGFFALGARGKTAERVADEAVEPLLTFLASRGAVDEHAADQLITLAALCPEPSRLLTSRVSNHLLTNAMVIRRLTGRAVRIEGNLGEGGTVTLEAAR